MPLTLKPKRKATAEPLDLELVQLDCPHFDQIVHISDVHIRPLKRHQEFESVFKTLAQDLMKLKQEGKQPLMVVTGDILDSKHVFKPETFYVCRRFMKMLSMIGPTLVIAGNHDMLERNTSRLDALSVPPAEPHSLACYRQVTAAHAQQKWPTLCHSTCSTCVFIVI